MRVPKLRFREFEGEWEERPLNSIFERITTKNTENNDNVLTISAQYGLISQTDFFSKSVAGKDLTKYYLLHRDDFAYNKSYSNGYPMGAIKRLKKYDKGVVSTLYICFNKKDNNNVDFLEQFFESQKIEKNIRDIAQEGARNHGLLNISVGDFFDICINIPTLAEQEKIGLFLSAVDKKIELTSSLLDEFKTYKKGLMQKIFTQKLRFKDVNGEPFQDWQEKRLGDLCKITTGKLDANAMVENGIYRFYTCAKEFYFINDYAFDTEALLISGNGANVGYIHYYKGKFNAYQRTYVLDNFEENILFIKYILEQNLKIRIEREKNSGNTPYIVLSVLTDMMLSLPSLAEQQKIADFLSSIDSKIDLLDKELEGLRAFKKSLLQQMFV